jgi:hypothetical protein
MVWQRSGSCCGGYIVYLYCLWFDRGVVHVVFVILSTITVFGLTEEWFMLLLLYFLPLLCKVWQRSGWCCCYIFCHYCLRFDWSVSFCCYIVYHYCLRLTDEWFMLLLLYCIPLLFKVWQRSGSCCGCYIINHYCLRFGRGVVHVVVGIFSSITALGLTEEWFMWLLLYCLPLLFNVWQRSSSCCCCYIAYHYCLRYDRGLVHVVVVILSTITV